MDRRRFLLTSLAGALVAPLAAEAQQTDKIWRIGTLHTSPEKDEAERVAALERGWPNSATSPDETSSSSTGTPERRGDACPTSPPIWFAPGST